MKQKRINIVFMSCLDCPSRQSDGWCDVVGIVTPSKGFPKTCDAWEDSNKREEKN